MFLSLHVKNLALIAEEEVEFSEGLNILTGETGAGKSIIIGSIGLALGAKADKTIIRDGADAALVELTFRADSPEQIRRLESMNLSVEDDGIILIKRRITPTRNVSSVNGETVTSRELHKIQSFLIDIYGQRENQTLLKRERQLGILDEYAGEEAAELLGKTRASYASYSSLLTEWEENDLDENARRREIELLDFEINELEAAALVPGEDEKLEKEYRKMSGAEKLAAAACTALSYTNSEGGASDGIARALRELAGIEGDDGELDEITGQLSEIEDLLTDFNRALMDYSENLTFDPSEFAAVEERLNLINHLKDKYGPSLKDIAEALEERRAKAENLADYAAHRKRLKERLDQERKEFLSLCGRLSKVRRKAAAEFAAAIKKELLELNFAQVEFEIRLETKEEYAGSAGYDKCVFEISMNQGEALRPLETIASGGELSRIMLALKTVFAGKDDIHTFIFDEIDTGISGQTAWKVAEKLGRLSLGHQILCITHLPQIAAMEDVHYVIRKKAEDGRTFTHIRKLSDEESNEELARLLGGMEITDAVMQNAEDMKKQARKAKENGRKDKQNE